MSRHHISFLDACIIYQPYVIFQQVPLSEGDDDDDDDGDEVFGLVSVLNISTDNKHVR